MEVNNINERLAKRYMTGDETTKFIKNMIEKEVNLANDRVTYITNIQQDQLDDLFYNHVSSPGLVNLKADVLDPLAAPMDATFYSEECRLALANETSGIGSQTIDMVQSLTTKIRKWELNAMESVVTRLEKRRYLQARHL